MYGDQPAGWSITGEKENVRKFTRDDFMVYRELRYVPEGTLLSSLGKFDEKGGYARGHARFRWAAPVSRACESKNKGTPNSS